MKKANNVINLKDVLKTKKGFFHSQGYATIKKTGINESGEQEEKIIKILISPVGDHPVLKIFSEKYPAPKPPVINKMINKDTGEDAATEGITLSEAKRSSVYGWSSVYDYVDEEYRNAIEKYTRKVGMIRLMIVFDLIDQYGIDKTEEFEKDMEDLGFSSNQLNKILLDVKNLDTF